MRTAFLSAGLLILCSARLAAQESDTTAPTLGHRTVRAVSVNGVPPVLDGRLDDPVWQYAPVATDFVEQGPVPGARPRFRTEVQVAFDDRALYLAVRAWDPHPDSIVAPLARRDDEANSDWIFVEIDSRHDRRTGFGFGVNPRGVQVDATFDRFINYDYAWDGVWEAAPRIDSVGWAVEYRIPFSQLAYSGHVGAPMTFGLNVYRRVTRTGESSDWSPRLPTYADLMSHFNDIIGIAPPRASGRLELVPYAAARATANPERPGDPFRSGTTGAAYAGADLRYHLASGFTIVGALHPDFGQVEADPSQVNLTTFETFLPEQRPFFVQGENDFAFDISLPFESRGNSFTSEQPFYSRRIGRPPHGGVPTSARFADVPASTTLLGAAKLSGRSSSGWTVGAMAALSGEATARYLDSLGTIRSEPVDPLTGIGVVRVVKESDDGAGTVGLIVTGLGRPAMPAALDSVAVDQALAGGFDARRRFGNGVWEASGFVMGSRIQGSPAAIAGVLRGPGHFFQRPDASYLGDDSTRTSMAGVAAQLRLARVAGNLKWAVIGHVISPGFEVNDVGFQRNADWVLALGSINYDRYPRSRVVRHWSLSLDRLGVGWSFGGERRAATIAGRGTLGFRDFSGISIGVGHEFSALSLDQLRGGPALLLPPATTFSETFTSDARRPQQVTLTGTQTREPGNGSWSWDYSAAAAWRVTPRLAIGLTPEYGRHVEGWQYVDKVPTAGGAARYLIGRLDQRTASLTVRADWSFSSRMTLQLYAQPFVSAADYGAFGEVSASRATDPAARITRYLPAQVAYDSAGRSFRISPTGDPGDDFTFADPAFSERDFNASAVFRWEYLPGSTLYAVWTQARTQTAPGGAFDLGADSRDLFRAPHTDVFLIKMSHRLTW